MDFDQLTPEQAGKIFPIRIVPYSSEWGRLFEKEKALLVKLLTAEIDLEIEHIGSTSVEGLASKPTIDMLVMVPGLTRETKQFLTRKLATVGYGNMTNAEKENRMTFGKGYDVNHTNTLTFHVHIREKGEGPQDEIYFRDYLRQNPATRDAYAELKYSLAEQYRFNREKYTQAKTEFIVRITEEMKKKRYLF